MVSFKKCTRNDIIASVKLRTAKTPLIVSDDIIDDCVSRSVDELNNVVYSPRNVILENYGNKGVDVTDLKIDCINNMYYSGEANLNMLDPEMGIMPYLTVTGGIGMVDTVLDYRIYMSVLNGVRRILNTYDYELMPPDVDGRIYLQVRNAGSLLRVEYLPYLDNSLDEWMLFSHEILFLKQYAYCLVNHENCEVTAQASVLGVAKEALALVEYWEKQLDKVVEKFKADQVITYLQ